MLLDLATLAEVDIAGEIFYQHSGLILRNHLLTLGCLWLSLDFTPIGSFEVGS